MNGVMQIINEWNCNSITSQVKKLNRYIIMINGS